ncbi:MAG: lysylphosphatidylglycerol synthase transmembrane domain-containing protein [Candidatus Bathyarchaeia archaeon]
MIPERRKLIRRFLPFLVIGLLVIVCYLYFFVDVQEMIALLRSVNPLYYSLAVIALLLDTLFFSLTWHYFLAPLSIKTPFRKTFLFVWAATFVDILVPAESVSGDISKAYLMSKETGETERNAGKIAASIVSHRILGTVVVLGSLLGSCLSFFILRYRIPEEPVLGISISNWIILVTVGTSITLFFLFALALKEEITRKIMDLVFKVVVFISRGRWRLTGIRSKVRIARNAFHYAIKVLGEHPSSLARPVAFSLTSWFFSLLISSLVFVSLLGRPIHFGIVVIVYSLSCAIQSIPLGIPAEVGLTEVMMISLYTSFLRGTPGVVDVGALSAAATFLIRVLTVGLRLFIGFVAIQWVGAKALMGDSP